MAHNGLNNCNIGNHVNGICIYPANIPLIYTDEIPAVANSIDIHDCEISGEEENTDYGINLEGSILGNGNIIHNCKIDNFTIGIRHHAYEEMEGDAFELPNNGLLIRNNIIHDVSTGICVEHTNHP